MDSSGRSEVDAAFARFVSRRDPEDLAQVFDAVAPKLLLVGMHLLGDAAAAEDLLQGTFVEVIRSVDRFDINRPVMPWLLTILTRRAGKVRRGRGLVRRVEADLDTLQADGQEPSVQAAEREVIVQISAAIESLVGPCREVLMLRLVHDLRPVEIARALDRPLGTVHAQLHRGLERLRRMLPKSLAGALALVIGAERGLTAVRQRVIDEACRQMLPVMGTLAGGLLMKKILAAAAMVLILLTMGAWVLIGVEGGVGLQPLAPTLLPVNLGVVTAIVTQDEPSPSSTEQRHLVAAPSNTITFTGRVVAAESGTPIGGAEVHLRASSIAYKDPKGSSWENPPDVISSRDGLFEIAIEHHPGMEIEFSVSTSGRVTAVGTAYYLRSGVTLDLGDIEMVAGCELRVQVTDERGQPVEAYPLIRFQTPPDLPTDSRVVLPLSLKVGYDTSLTDADGRLPSITLPPGLWRIERGGWGYGLVGPREILVEPGERTKDVTIVLSIPKTDTAIAGRVVDRLGLPLSGIVLEGLQKGTGRRWGRAYSRSDGSFTMGGRSAGGPVALRPQDRRHFETVSPHHSIDIGTTEVELVISEVGTVTLVIDVVDEAGEAVEAFQYCLVQVDNPGWGTRVLGGSGFSEGKRQLGRRLFFEGVFPGDYLFHIRAKNLRFAKLQSMSIQVQSGDAHSARMILEDTRPWHVRIIDGNGEPIVGSRVELLQTFGNHKVNAAGLVTELEWYLSGGVGGMSLRAGEAFSDELGIAKVLAVRDPGNAAIRVTGSTHLPVQVSVTAPASMEEPLEIIVQGGGVIEGVIGPLEVVLPWGPSDRERELAPYIETTVEDLAVSMPGIVARPLGDAPIRDASIRGSIDHQGRFRIESLLPGDWELCFRGRLNTQFGFLRHRVGVVRDLKSGETRGIELSAPELLLAQISGVTFVDGQLPKILESALSGHLELVLKGPVTVVTRFDSAGRFEFPGLPAGRYSAYLVQNTSRWRIGADAPIDLAPGESVERVLHFNCHSLSVRILDSKGAPVRSRWVTLETEGLFRPERDDDRLHQKKSDADGRVVFDPVHRGDLVVLVWDESISSSRGPGLTRYSNSYVRLGPIQLRLDSSSTELELCMPTRK